MQHSTSFFKKTRSNKVLKVIQEHYLRDDIWCGHSLCRQCKQTPSSKLFGKSVTRIALLDTNAVLHQIDALENPAFDNVIV